MPEEEDEQIVMTLLSAGDKISRSGRCILIEYTSEDNAIIGMELFREIASGKTVTLGKPDAV